MTDELNFKRTTTPYAQIAFTDEQLDARNNLNTITAANNELQVFEATDNSLVSQLFGGMDVTGNKCKNCNYISKRWTPFQTLPVNFPPGCHGHNPLSNIRLDDLFKYKYNHEEVVHEVECQRCKVKGDFTRSDRLSAIPDYLIVNLVRFENRGADLEKVRTRVIFQESNIDLSGYWFEDPNVKLPALVASKLKPPFLYECYAAVAHRGSTIQSGHYLAFARSPDKPSNGAGSWHVFSDKTVSRSSWEEVQRHELTILFLKRSGV